MTEIIKIMEIIGTVAFALSGALVAINSGLDIFGVTFLACITAFGGGILRDMLLGINIPTIFSNFPIFALAMVVAVFTFVIAYIYKQKFYAFKIKVEAINNIFDAIGLAAFVVIGSEKACSYGLLNNGFFVVFSGMITGVGGGIFRDVLIDTTPYIFKKHIYAVASIIGAITYFVLRIYTENIQLASLLSMILVFVIRMLATKYRWSLPKVEINKTGDLNEKTK
ncbi:MAG: trimeric intracellular cation channel family protein [Clostridia bacterium]|nr:trimeric intracellular cation channel family protein [Clostridia bacterium]